MLYFLSNTCLPLMKFFFVPLQSQSFQAKCSLMTLMQTKRTLLPFDEIQNDIQADAGKDEPTVESIRHFKICMRKELTT